MLELISVHVPKCAGWSMYQALERVYSHDAILYDHADRPADPMSPMNLDRDGFIKRAQAQAATTLQGKLVVHGHFYVRKYEQIHARCRITFLRHPVERAISHYYYWLGSERHGHSLQDYVLDRQLSLVEFVHLPFIRFLYTKVFFRDVDMKTFDVIGSCESIEDDVRTVSRLLGKDLTLQRTNTNPFESYGQKQRDILADSKVRGALHDALAEDIRFYESAMALRK